MTEGYELPAEEPPVSRSARLAALTERIAVGASDWKLRVFLERTAAHRRSVKHGVANGTLERGHA